jgi:aminodeoxyfutalosine synthase
MTTLDALADRVLQGEGLSDADARTFLDTHDLIAIGAIGDGVRRRRHEGRATFVRVFEVHVDAPPASLPPRVDAGEFRIVGRPASIDAAEAAVKAAAALAGDKPVTGFSLADLQTASGGSLADALARLGAAGLESIASLPVDQVEQPEAAVELVRKAGLGLTRLTVQSLADDQRVGVVTRARDLQSAVGGFRVFAPLPESQSVTTPSTGYDDVKQIALARVVLTNIESIQVDWIQYGPKLAQVALTVGADDIDRVSAVDPGLLGTRRSPLEEIRNNIRAAGLEAIERNGRYESLAARAR